MTGCPTISVESIELRGRCGVSAEERAVGQTLIVDVELEPVVCTGTETDDLEGTVNYSRVVDTVRRVVAEREFKLLERLATVIADELWSAHQLAALRVAVAKVAPPVAIPVKAARVAVSRRR